MHTLELLVLLSGSAVGWMFFLAMLARYFTSVSHIIIEFLLLYMHTAAMIDL